MGWIALVVGAVLVFAIAAAFVGSEAFRLGHETPAAIFDVDDATREVGDGLPDDVQARLTYDEVKELILASLAHLESKGLAAPPGRDRRIIGERDEVVVADDDTVAVVLGAVDNRGLDVSDEDAFEVIRGLLALPRPDRRARSASLTKTAAAAALLVVHWCHQRREVVHHMNDCCSGTLEVAGR